MQIRHIWHKGYRNYGNVKAVEFASHLELDYDAENHISFLIILNKSYRSNACILMQYSMCVPLCMLIPNLGEVHEGSTISVSYRKLSVTFLITSRYLTNFVGWQFLLYVCTGRMHKSTTGIHLWRHLESQENFIMMKIIFQEGCIKVPLECIFTTVVQIANFWTIVVNDTILFLKNRNIL